MFSLDLLLDNLYHVNNLLHFGDSHGKKDHITHLRKKKVVERLQFFSFFFQMRYEFLVS